MGAEEKRGRRRLREDISSELLALRRLEERDEVPEEDYGVRRMARGSLDFRRERHEAMEKALSALSPEHQQILGIHMRGLSIKELARRMGRTPAAVGALYVRALRKLRASFKAVAGESGIPVESPQSFREPTSPTEKEEDSSTLLTLYSRLAEPSGSAGDWTPGEIGTTGSFSLTGTHCLRAGSAMGSWTPVPVAAETSWENLQVRAQDTLGSRYLILGLLAKGGMSRVYRGIDRKLDRPVAIKVVPPPFGELVEKSQDLASGLGHPNIVSVEARSSAKETLLLVMPLLDGSSLRNLLPAHGSLQGALLLALRAACEGVAHAHGRGIVHRDLKPSNIQVEGNGRAVVLDWGLACAAGHEPGAGAPVVGTPAYMAPEQLDGGALTPRTDVYALGVLLYETLTGRNPAGPGSSLSAMAHRIRKETPPPPSVLGSRLPEGLDEVVLRCLKKSPAERFLDAGELLEALEGLPLA